MQVYQTIKYWISTQIYESFDWVLLLSLFQVKRCMWVYHNKPMSCSLLHTKLKIQKIYDNPIYLHKKVNFWISFQTCTKYAENCIQSVSIRTAVSCKRWVSLLARPTLYKALEIWHFQRWGACPAVTEMAKHPLPPGQSPGEGLSIPHSPLQTTLWQDIENKSSNRE